MEHALAWQVDPSQLVPPLSNTRPQRQRLVSPSLSARYHVPDFGIHGSPKASPERVYAVVTSDTHRVTTILKPVKGKVSTHGCRVL